MRYVTKAGAINTVSFSEIDCLYTKCFIFKMTLTFCSWPTEMHPEKDKRSGVSFTTFKLKSEFYDYYLNVCTCLSFLSYNILITNSVPDTLEGRCL